MEMIVYGEEVYIISELIFLYDKEMVEGDGLDRCLGERR